MADQYGMDLETVKKYLQADQVKDQLKSQKAIAVVADSATAIKPEKKTARKSAKKAEDAEGEEKPAEEKPAKKTTRKKAEKAEDTAEGRGEEARQAVHQEGRQEGRGDPRRVIFRGPAAAGGKCVPPPADPPRGFGQIPQDVCA